MASPRKFLGKVPFSRALRLTTHVIHTSRHAREKQGGFLEIPGEVVQELENSIEKYGQAGRTHVRLPSWRRMLELAREMGKYVGRRPSYAQALGALVLSKGLDNPELRPYAIALHSLHLRAAKKDKPLISESNKAAVSAFTQQTIGLVHNGISTPEPKTVRELAETTEMPRYKLEQLLRILEAARLATMLPSEPESAGKSYRRILTENRFSTHTKPTSNYAWKVMETLADGPKKLSDIVRFEMKGKRIGGGSLPPKNAVLALRNLQQQGIVSTERNAFDRLHRSIKTYCLNEPAKELVREQQAKGHLTEAVRLILLGHNFTGLFAHEQENLENFVNYVRIREAHQAYTPKQRREGIIANLQNRFQTTRSKVRRAAYSAPPWRRFSLGELENVYLPAMKAFYPHQAEWLEKDARQNRSMFRRAKTRRRHFKPEITPLYLFEQHQPIAYGLAGREWRRNYRLYSRASTTIEELEQHALLALKKLAESGEKTRIGPFAQRAARYVATALKNFGARVAKQQKRRSASLNDDAGGRQPLSTNLQSREEKQGDNEARGKLIEMINGLKGSERDKKMLIAKFGLETGEPQTSKQLETTFGVSKRVAESAPSNLLRKLRKHSKVNELRGLLD